MSPDNKAKKFDFIPTLRRKFTPSKKEKLSPLENPLIIIQNKKFPRSMTINQRKCFPKDKKALEMLNPWRISGVTKKEYEH